MAELPGPVDRLDVGDTCSLNGSSRGYCLVRSGADDDAMSLESSPLGMIAVRMRSRISMYDITIRDTYDESHAEVALSDRSPRTSSVYCKIDDKIPCRHVTIADIAISAAEG